VPRYSFFPQVLVKSWLPYLLLAILGCLFFLPGFTKLPPTDRDEARFAQASRQMLETKNYVDIRFQERPRYKKPIGIYWLQAFSAGLIEGPNGRKIWPYRLPSLLGTLAAVLLTFRLGKTFFSPVAGFMGALFLESGLLLHVEARIATTDAVLLAVITGMMGLLGEIYLSQNNDNTWIKATGFWILCGFGILLKGPVSPLVALLSIGFLIVSEKNWTLLRRLHPACGIFLLSMVVMPWFIAVQKATHGRFVETAVMKDLLPKLIGGHESHGAPPGYYLILFPFLFGPGILFVAGALKRGWKLRKFQKPFRFLFSWILPAWIVFELIPTKLPHYILPIFPAVSLMAGCYVTSQWAGEKGNEGDDVKRTPGIFSKGLFILSTLFVGLGSLILSLYFKHTITPAALLVMASALAMVGIMVFFHGKQFKTLAVILCLVGSLGMAAPVFQSVLPSLDPLWISREVAAAVGVSDRTRAIVASVGYHEPSLVFLLGTDTKLTDLKEVINLLENQKITHVLIPDGKCKKLISETQKRGIYLRRLKIIRGFNYSKGKWMTLCLFAVKPSIQGESRGQDGVMQIGQKGKLAQLKYSV